MILPEWLWSIIIGVIVVGLVAALRNADRERLAKLEQWAVDKDKRDHDWRHDEYAPYVGDLALKTERLLTKMERVDRELNGRLKDQR